MQKFNAEIKNANIRGCEKKQNKNGDFYLLVRLEEENGNPVQLVDKDLSREELYKRDATGTIKISIDDGKFTTIRIEDFTTG